MSQRVTMEEVARRSGVSLATVSLVLRDKPGINDETRRRVLDTARDLGYRRRASGEGAPTPGRALQQVGVVVKSHPDDPPHTNPFYGPILGGIEALCRRQQINLLYGTLPVDEDNRPIETPRLLDQADLDGILFLGAIVEGPLAELFERRARPVVLVDAYARSGAYDAVLTDNVGGAYAATAHLLARGHRRIALAGSLPDGYPSIDERRRGYTMALADHGVLECYFADAHIYGGDIGAAVAELLGRYPQISALFCTNDATAIQAIRAARAVGRRLPEELSIVGFDDIDLAEHLSPALTTMHVDKIGMGRLALQLLASRVERPEAGLVNALIRPVLVERGSVCDAPSAGME